MHLRQHALPTLELKKPSHDPTTTATAEYLADIHSAPKTSTAYLTTSTHNRAPKPIASNITAQHLAVLLLAYTRIITNPSILFQHIQHPGAKTMDIQPQPTCTEAAARLPRADQQC